MSIPTQGLHFSELLHLDAYFFFIACHKSVEFIVICF